MGRLRTRVLPRVRLWLWVSPETPSRVIAVERVASMPMCLGLIHTILISFDRPTSRSSVMSTALSLRATIIEAGAALSADRVHSRKCAPMVSRTRLGYATESSRSLEMTPKCRAGGGDDSAIPSNGQGCEAPKATLWRVGGSSFKPC